MTNLSFEHIQIVENSNPMVNLKEYPFDLSPKYFEWNLSNTPDLWVRQAIADKLLEVQRKHLSPMGRKFKIWDPWRSRSVQKNIYQKFWNELAEKNPNWSQEKLVFEVGVFVTYSEEPTRIPPHATGGSIDLTVVEEDGTEVDFGTEFDHFGPEAATNYFEINDKDVPARENRHWLHEVMVEGGFETDPDEWWHFDYGNQKWAVQLGEATAFFGEVVDPLKFNNRLKQEIKHALT